MRRSALATMAMAMVVLVLAAGCGGSTSGGSSAIRGGILRVGTTGYIDSLNIFDAYNGEAYNAFVMLYPQLVQYGPPGVTLEPDWATSWRHSKNDLTWTFTLRTGGRWSDGVPLTAADAAWTINTVVKYQTGPTATMALAVTGISHATAPNAHTLVITYARPQADPLAQLEVLFILPKHIWEHHVGQKGKGLTAYNPAASLPMVGGGPYYVSQFQEKGTTVFRKNRHFYGPPSHADAVTMTYYTNPTSMVADLEAGNVDFIDSMPFSAVGAVKQSKTLAVQLAPSDVVTNITFNSNPAKQKNRELLDPEVKKALEYATPRQQIIDIVFSGYAKPWANLISEQSQQAGWVDPAVQPLPYDPAKANRILDSLGYRMINGTRMVPATTGRYAQPAHPMSYGVIVPDGLGFDADRQFLILQAAYRKIGVHLNEIPGGDTDQAYALETAGAYTKYDMATWSWAGYVDPNYMLGVLTRSQWYSESDTGFDDPTYDRWFAQQGRTINPSARRALVFRMEQFIANQRPYIQLVNEDTVTAHDDSWTGFLPELNGYCKCYYTSPHRIGPPANDG